MTMSYALVRYSCPVSASCVHLAWCPRPVRRPCLESLFGAPVWRPCLVSSFDVFFWCPHLVSLPCFLLWCACAVTSSRVLVLCPCRDLLLGARWCPCFVLLLGVSLCCWDSLLGSFILTPWGLKSNNTYFCWGVWGRQLPNKTHSGLSSPGQRPIGVLNPNFLLVFFCLLFVLFY